jgi:hypothetical protein
VGGMNQMSGQLPCGLNMARQRGSNSDSWFGENSGATGQEREERVQAEGAISLGVDIPRLVWYPGRAAGLAAGEKAPSTATGLGARAKLLRETAE